MNIAGDADAVKPLIDAGAGGRRLSLRRNLRLHSAFAQLAH